MLGQFAIGGQLPAEDGEQRRLAVLIVNIQRVVAGDRLRRIRLVVAQRTDAGVGPDDIVLAEGLFKVRVIDVQQVINLFIINGHRFRIALILDVRRADDRELIHPRDNKHNTFIFVLQNVGLLLGMYPRHHDVAALNQADTVRRAQMHPFVEELFDPWTGGIDQTARLPGKLLAAINIFRFHHPQAILSFCRDGASAGAYFAAFADDHLRVGQHQAGIVDPAVGIFETAHNFRLKYRFCAKTQAGGSRQAGAFAQMIVHKQADTDHPCWTQMRAMRETKAHREGDMRGHF